MTHDNLSDLPTTSAGRADPDLAGIAEALWSTRAPALLLGEPGTDLIAMARCINDTIGRRHNVGRRPLVRLRCSGLTEDVLSPESGDRMRRRHARKGPVPVAFDQSSELDILVERALPHGALLLTDIEMAPLPVQRRILEVLDDSAPRVLATTFASLSALEREVEEGRFLRELLQHLRVRGQVIWGPPLCLRFKHLPKLISREIWRLNRREVRAVEKAAKKTVGVAQWYCYSDIEVEAKAEAGKAARAEVAKAEGVTQGVLYWAAAARWPGNDDQLRRCLREARQKVSPEGDVPFNRPPFPQPFDFAPDPFGPDTTDDRRTDSCPQWWNVPVSLADLPAFDLEALLRRVDQKMRPEARGRWTLEARLTKLSAEPEEATLRRPDEALPASLPAVHQIIPVRTPSGATWEELTAEVDATDKSRRVIFSLRKKPIGELCCQHLGSGRRRGEHPAPWALLLVLMIGGGNTVSRREWIKRRQRLNDALRKRFPGMEGDAVVTKGTRWVTRFQVVDVQER